MNTDGKKRFLINFTYALSILALSYVALKYLLGIFLPFIIGFFIAFALRPAIDFTASRTKIPRKVCAALIVVLAYGVIGSGVFFLIWLGVTQFSALVQNFPDIYNNDIAPALDTLVAKASSVLHGFSPELYDQLLSVSAQVSDSFSSMLASFSSGVVKSVTNTASKIPGFVLGFIFTIISSVFISLDYRTVTAFVVRQLPDRHKHLVSDIKGYLVGSIFSMLRAYLILMSMTFLELSIGLSILRAEYAVTIAIIIACVDILPVVGSGVVIVPWIAIEFIRGNYYFAIGLTVLYAIVGIIRNIVEPKIVGGQIGLHPLLTLVSMYVGVRLFGFVGLFMPILVIILKNLNDTGKIRIYK